MVKAAFTKLAATPEQLLAKLEGRGLLVSDKAATYLIFHQT